MAALRLKERLEFDVLKTVEDRLAYAVVQSLANNGHGDIGSCGVAEFVLIEFAEALDTPPGETLRRLKALAAPINALCVEHENTILFALAGADQAGFAHLYKSRGFEGLAPNLPKVTRRVCRYLRRARRFAVS